ncbi:hypothetical protein [Chryseobacterium cheonjiense]|uniref:Uncharacterized protein n=1 Tax=Chryseobacterium cheonjiense TaxID=2728845 RepID=A0A7Y0FJH9_9FLAO|nr:hypothetical protein [Chryseobacterium cheonjiense]NML58406.1 hypothetical protein [Chryseobacterium cheonjiense]
MEVNIKQIIKIYFICFYSCLFSQKIQFSIENKTLEYTENDVNIQYIIKNNNKFPVFFVLNSNDFAIYNNHYDYYIDNRKVTFENNKDEKIFDPRIILVDRINKKDTIDIIPTKNVLPDIKYLEDCNQKEKKIVEEEKKEIYNFQKKYFPNQDLIWNKRAKYVNENLHILLPMEELKVNTKVNLSSMIKNPENCDLYNMGFNLEKKQYLFSIKMHNDINFILKYLTKENKENIKKINAKSLKEDFYSNTIILNIKEIR